MSVTVAPGKAVGVATSGAGSGAVRIWTTAPVPTQSTSGLGTAALTPP